MDLLYDAGRGGLASSVVYVVLGVALIAFGVFRFVQRDEDKRDPSMTGAGGVIFALLGVALSVWAGTNLTHAVGMKLDPVGRNAQVIEGCVSAYRKVVHEDHKLTITDFIVNGAPFHFSSSLWGSGYHEAGNTIVPGDRLRIVMRDGRVQKLYRLTPGCR